MEAKSSSNGSCSNVSGGGIHEYRDWGVDGADQEKYLDCVFEVRSRSRK
jgi:hypothetical protein